MKALKLIRAWKRSAGPVLLQQARFLGLHQDANGLYLLLEIPDPMWRQELIYQREEILLRYNECLRQEGIPISELPQSCSFGTNATLPFKSINAKQRGNK